MAYLKKNNNRLIRESEFNEKLSYASAKFYDMHKDLEQVLIIAHSDADGYGAGIILKKMCQALNIPTDIVFFNRKGTWTDFLDRILPKYDNYDNFCVFFADLGSEIREISQNFEDDFAHIFILDHHEVMDEDKNINAENVDVINPTLYGYDGLKEIAGSALCYFFAKNVSLKNIQNAWIALIGISGDTLMRIDDWKSFNLEVLEDALNEEQIIIEEGVCTFGASHDLLKNVLAYSILPYIKEIEGDPEKAVIILNKLDINPNKKIENLTENEINSIDKRFKGIIKGKYIVFPKKKTILRYAFEHASIVNVSAFKFSSKTEDLIASSTAPAEIKAEHMKYIKSLTKNLALFDQTPKQYSKYGIFVDAKKRIAKNYWSDVSSFASVNHMYSDNKILFIGGLENQIVKLSVRCSEFFPSLSDGKGVDIVIHKLIRKYGGVGGGHKLAGGYKVAPNRYKKILKEFDEIFPL